MILELWCVQRGCDRGVQFNAEHFTVAYSLHTEEM